MTNIAELLGIKYPIIQGGMAWIAESTLAAAVSNGGGLGLIASGSAPTSWIRSEVRKAKEMTDKPFGVNVMMMNPEVEDIMAMLIEEKVSVVTTGAGNPGKFIAALKDAKIKVLPVIANTSLAKRVERAGADAVIAEGMEGGGHIGDMTTMALTPQVVDAVNIPVVTAGGVADGRGIAAAYMLGASGVQVGTRFLAAKECQISEPYRQKVLNAKDTDSVVTGVTTGHPVRVLKNKMTRKIGEMEKTGVDPMEFEELLIGTLRKAVVDGDVDYGSVMAGQVAGLVNKVQSAEEIIREMFEEADKLCNRL